MSKGIILWHIPIYVLAIWGFITICLLASLPQGNRSQVNIPDGNIEYTNLDFGLSMQNIVAGISLKSTEQLLTIQKCLGREDAPRQSAIWIYISLDKRSPNVVLFQDYIFACSICHSNDVFDLYRSNYVYDMKLRSFNNKECYWRESIMLSNYLIPAPGIKTENNSNGRASYDN